MMEMEQTIDGTPMANAYHAPKKSSRKKKNVELFDVDDLEAR